MKPFALKETHGEFAPVPPAPFRLVGEGFAAGDRLRGAVLLLGNFDGFHRGHRALLDAARRVAQGRPLALMSCEPHPRSFFAPAAAPFRLTTPATKRAVLAPFGFGYLYAPAFDAAFAGQSPEAFITGVLVRALGVAHVVTGEDFRFGKGRAGDVAALRAAGAAAGFGVTAVGEVAEGGERCSSSRIRELLRLGRLAEANRLLGHDWLVEIGAEAAGPHLHPALCRPAPGRYAARPAGRVPGPVLHFTLDAEGNAAGAPAPGLYHLLHRQG